MAYACKTLREKAYQDYSTQDLKVAEANEVNLQKLQNNKKILLCSVKYYRTAILDCLF